MMYENIITINRRKQVPNMFEIAKEARSQQEIWTRLVEAQREPVTA